MRTLFDRNESENSLVTSEQTPNGSAGREQVRPIGIDLFAGAGGMSLGFEQAGFDVAAAVEIDPIHAATHAFNFPRCQIIPRSVIGLNGDDIRAEARLGDRQIDVVFGGAPCQGFSLIGQRAIDDPRNILVKEFVRLVGELDATYFVFENVKGLTVGRHRKFLDELIAEFETAGYDVRKPWHVLNASRYGVPQERQRLILFGAKRGTQLPNYPSDFLDGAPACKDALSDLPEAENYPELLVGDYVETTEWGEPSPFARRMRCLSNESWGYGYPRNWIPNLLTSSMRTNHTEISRRRFTQTEPGKVEPISRFFRLSADGLSNTLRAGTDASRGAFTSPRPIHYGRSRCITVREMARLHSFPDWFRFNGTKWHGARQVGNSVPPMLAQAVASQVIEFLGTKLTKPDTAIDLGDTKLLRMDLSQASAYWGVPNPIGRRDRKSGARKRKQEEIEADRIAQEGSA